jgi:hypothetical protein
MATRSPARNGTRTSEAPGRSTAAADDSSESKSSESGPARQQKNPRGRSQGGNKRRRAAAAGARRGETSERESGGGGGGGGGSRIASSLQAVQGGGRRVAETLKTAGSTVRGSVAGHPVPAVLIGAGLAWLLLESRLSGASSDRGFLAAARRRYEESAAGAAEGVESALGSAKESLVDGAEAVVEFAGRLGEYAQRGASAVGSTLREGASTVGEGARKGYESSKRAVGNVWEEHPLTSGLALLAAGVTLGMLLPSTRREDDMMGSQSDSLTRRIKEAGASLLQRGEQVVSSVGGVLTGDSAAPQSGRRKSGGGGSSRRKRS